MISREEILNGINSLFQDEQIISAAKVIKLILTLDEQEQSSIENYLEQKKDNCFPPTLRIIDSIGGLSKQERNIIDSLDALDEQRQYVVKLVLKDKEILFGRRTA